MVRFKNRYVLFEIKHHAQDASQQTKSIPSHALNYTEKHILAEIRSKIRQAFGEYGASLISSLTIKFFNPKTGMGIMRVSRAHCQMACSALILITSIARSENEQSRDKVSFSVVALCGTIRNCQLKAIEHDKALINSFYSQKNCEAKALMESSAMEIENALATT